MKNRSLSKPYFLFLFFFANLFTQKLFAADANPAEQASSASTDAKPVDFSAKDLWDKDLSERDDNKVIVIQDRKYNKAGRFEFGLDAGVTDASAFYNSYSFGARAAYYFSEYWGIQAFGNYSLNTDTNEKKQLQNYLSVSGFESTKEVQQPRLFTGIGAVWSPIYGKFAFFRSDIIHFDFFVGLGLSYLTTQQVFMPNGSTGKTQGYPGTLENIGFRVFMNKHYTWTTEVRNNVYIAKYSATTSGGGKNLIEAQNVSSNNFQFMTGFSYLIGSGGQ